MPIYINPGYGEYIEHGDLLKFQYCQVFNIFVNYTSILNTFYYCYGMGSLMEEVKSFS